MASHNSDNYKHTQLAHADSIRLLELLPGPRGSPLACNIFEARKHDNPEYEALSYAWGEPVFSHVVQEVSSGREIRVTINLEQALQAIRYEHAARILWADAICINQSDLKEKGHQVALMGEIYRDANRVVVWLGGPQIGSTRLLSVLHDLVEAYKGRNWWESIDTVLDRMEVRESLRFLNQPWFTRVWVVQEFVLARNIQFVVAHTTIPLGLFAAVLTCLKEVKRPEWKADYWRADICSTATRIHQLFVYREARFMNGREGRHLTDTSLASCIQIAKGRRCKDFRDRIYAMLALANDNLDISPDYTLSGSALSNSLAIRSLLKGELSVLHISEIGQNSERGTCSFAPNLRPNYMTPLPLNMVELGFSAFKKIGSDVRAISAQVISISGVSVGTIRLCFTDLHDFEMQLSHDKFKTFFHSASLATLPAWTTFITRNLHQPYVSWTAALRWLMMLKIGSPRTSDKEPKGTDIIAEQHLKNRFLFQTGQGYLGVGPAWMKTGDRVVIFAGGVTPFILRELVSDDGTPTSQWQLVGDCYLLGWMDGDFFGHTLVDEHPSEVNFEGEPKGETGKKYLVKKPYVLV